MRKYLISVSEDHINRYQKFPYPINFKEAILSSLDMHPNEVTYMGRSNNSFHYYYTSADELTKFLEKLENSSNEGIDVRIQSANEENLPTDLREMLKRLLNVCGIQIPAAPLP